MLSYHVVLNACWDDYAKQARELNGFIQNNPFGNFTQGTTFIVCGSSLDGGQKRELADLAPTRSVIFVMQDYYEPEGVLAYLSQIAQKHCLYLFGSNFSGWELSIRLAQRIEGSSIQGCTRLRLAEGNLLADKMAYANHMKGVWRLNTAPYCVAIAKGQDEASPISSDDTTLKEVRINAKEPGASIRKGFEPNKTTGSLTNAPFVLVAGRGIRKKEAATTLSNQAKTMGAAFGASRPVVMNAWAPMENLVGVSGAMLKPEICIAAGVSGAPALYAGIEKSKFLVAINADEKAPIIKKSDVAIVGDCEEAINALAQLIEGEE